MDKSTVTVLLGSLFYYSLGYNVVLLDCDLLQHSLVNIRERGNRTIIESDVHKNFAVHQFHTSDKKAYPMIKCALERAFGFCQDS